MEQFAIPRPTLSLDGYVFPFEGEKHLATIVALPYREDTWREKALPALKEFSVLVDLLRRREWVVLLADPRLPSSLVKEFERDHVHVLRIPYDDCWTRDFLPVFLRNPEGRLVGVDYGFNAWGGTYDGLYSPWDQDERAGAETLLELGISRYGKQKDFILEGGSIHTDGQGTLLVTSCCLLSPGRNPGLSQEEIEERLKQSLNVKKVIWLPKGIVNDETDGHVDNMACFLKPGVVGLAWSEDPEDPQYPDCIADLEVLEKETDAEGRPLTVVKIPLPKPEYLTREEAAGIVLDGKAVERLEGRRLAASYVNFYQGEDYVILPQFGDKEADLKAVSLFREIYPEKAILPMESHEILLGGGNIHCVTKQIPYTDQIQIEEAPASRHHFYDEQKEDRP